MDEKTREQQPATESERLYIFVSTQMRAGMTLGFFNPDDERWRWQSEAASG